MSKGYRTAALAAAGLWMLTGVTALAGDLDSPAAPSDAGSAMYTLEDVYNRLDTGAAGAKRAGPFVEPASPPGSTGRTLDETMAKAPALDAANGAAPGDVLSGKTFWGLLSGTLGTQTGTVPAGGNVSGADGSLVTTITDGLYSGSKTATASDTDLVTGNIKADVNIFGVDGKTEVVDTTSGDAVAGDLASGKKAWVDGVEVTGTAYPALVAKTGQTTVYRTGDDGTYQKGVAPTGARFTDNGDGTVTDNLTGLIWTKDANIWGLIDWNTAVDNCLGYSLASYTDWRLPNLRELQSLVDYKNYYSGAAGSSALPTVHPFSNVQVLSVYWSSTTWVGNSTTAWYLYMDSGNINPGAKADPFYVWPVRGP